MATVGLTVQLVQKSLNLETCDNNCNNRGICYKGKCHCMVGYDGVACDKNVKSK